MNLAFSGRKTEIESELIKHGFQVFNVHERRKVFSATPAMRTYPFIARFLVKGNSQRQRPLDNVKQFSEREI
jgi:hypothetical protein